MARIDEAVATRLRLAGDLPSGRWRDAVRLARDDAFWRRWAQRALLALALGHLLAAAVFFFAFNWQALTPLAKLGGIQVALVAAALASRLPLPRIAAEASLIAASVLIGVLFAVFGQIYQTGADAWTLFVLWAALMLPWVLAARSPGHWLVWMLVAQVAAAAFVVQTGHALHPLLAAALPAAALLVAREALAERLSWLAPGWTRLAPLAVVLVLLWLMGAERVVDWVHSDAPWWPALPFPLAAAAIGAFAGWRRDLAAMAVVVLGVCGFVALGLARAIQWDEPALMLLGWSAEIVVVFGAGVWLLRRARRNWSLAHD